MITSGFVAGYVDYATIDSNFPFTSSYLAASVVGDIVFENNLGQAQFIPEALVIAGMLMPAGAKRILSAGTVNGTPRTTTATGIVYWSAGTF
jgi:hypothetical protein